MLKDLNSDVCFDRLDGKPEQGADLPTVSATTLATERAATPGALSSHLSPKPVVNSGATAGDYFIHFYCKVVVVVICLS
jgi:hypothetical protein